MYNFIFLVSIDMLLFLRLGFTMKMVRRISLGIVSPSDILGCVRLCFVRGSLGVVLI